MINVDYQRALLVASPVERAEHLATPGQRKTAKARATRTRTKHDRWAAELREAGWDVIAPGETRGEGG